MNYADIKKVDIQDGIGVRVSIYVSGCHFHCEGCHNQEAWDFNYGKKFTDETIEYILDLMNHDYIAGLSILGGEPMELINQEGLVKLVELVKEKYPEKTIWCYTGYDFEKDILEDMYKKYEFTRKLLKNIDIMIDGQFIQSKNLIDLKFRGSYNQRKVDVKASLEKGEIVTLKFGDEARFENNEEVAKTNKKVKAIPVIEYDKITKKPAVEHEGLFVAESPESELILGENEEQITFPGFNEEEIPMQVAASSIIKNKDVKKEK